MRADRPSVGAPPRDTASSAGLDTSVPLAIRKQMLVLRAAVQREELAQGLLAVRRSAAAVGRGGPSWANLGRALSLWKLSREHPAVGSALGSILSVGLSRWRWPALRYAGLALSAAWLGWQGWDLLQRARQHTSDVHHQRRRAAADRPTGRKTPSRERSGGAHPAGQPAGADADLALLRRMQALARQIDSLS